jgi:hypothetical protein
MLLAYITPDVILPFASVLAAGLGVVLAVGRAPFRLAAKSWRYLRAKIHR